jgi:hypothetical protein
LAGVWKSFSQLLHDVAVQVDSNSRGCKQCLGKRP